MKAVRVLAVFGSLVVAAWFGVGVHQAIETGRATTRLSAASSITPADAERIRALLDSASVLNPDRGVDLLRGQLALQLGRHRQTQRIVSRVTRAEPDNLDAWLLLARAATDNPALFQQALVQVHRLEPRLPFSRG
jgi:hypothetical protein